MKALVCELCGSNDIIKRDGCFICQHCGTKYYEEAERTQKDQTVGVGGIASDRSSEIDNMLKNADATFEDGYYQEAFSLYSQVLNLNPDNPHATLYRALSSVWQSSVQNCRISEISSASKRAFRIQHNLCRDSKGYFDFCYNSVLDIAPLINSIAQMYVKYYNEAKPKTDLSITAAISTNLSAEVENTLRDGTKSCCTVCSNVIAFILDGVKDYSESDEDFWDVLHTLAQNAITYRNNAEIAPDPELKEQLRYVDELKEKAIKQIEARRAERAAAYWSEHTEEKAELEARKTAAEKVKAELAMEMASIPELLTAVKMQGEIEKLSGQMKELGLLKIAEKKALQAQINTIKGKLGAVETTITRKKADLQTQIDRQVKTIKEIDEELTLIR